MNAKLISLCAMFVLGFLSTGRAQLVLLDQFDPNVGQLVSAGFDAAQDRVWTYSSFATNMNSYTRAGVLLGSIPSPGEGANDVDIEFVTESFMLNNTLVPSNSLLFINGETGTADIYAVNPDTGVVITNLVTAFGNNHVVGGAWHPHRGTIFLVADQNDITPSTIAEINPNTGAVITNFPAGFTVNFGDIEVNHITSNLLVASDVQTSLRELTPDGVFVRSLVLPNGVAAISGIGADDARGSYFLSSTSGDVFLVGPGAQFLGPCPYLSFGNSPFGGLECAPFFLEDFEDLLLNVTGVVASTGSPFGPGGLTDSVDGDDGTIDGSGTFGHSFFSGDGAGGITFTFNAGDLGSLPTHVGIVWTDSGVGATILFEAFGPGNVSLGVIGPTNLAGVFPDGNNNGGTAEDRFFGVVSPAGIAAIKISNSAGGIEVDHLQYGICTGIVPNLCPSSPPPVCSLTPPLATNTVGQTHTVTATVTTNGVPVAGLAVSFSVTGAHTIAATNVTTAGNGEASFSYDGVNTGTDTILVAGGIGANEFSCDATKVWINAPPSNSPPVAVCQSVTTNAGANCMTALTALAFDGGSTDNDGSITGRSISPTGPFDKGVHQVILTVTDNDGAFGACTTTVTVVDKTLPVLTCNDATVTAPAGQSNAVALFSTTAIDSCGAVTLSCTVTSGATFNLGVTPVTCTAVDEAANTNTCTFNVTVNEAPPETHDLALIKMKAPKNINLKGAEPSLTKFVKVTLQNRSPHDEVITNFTGLVTLVAESLGTNCPNATVALHPGPPNNPKTLKPKQKMTVTFDVTWTCANDPAKGAGHEDFRYLAAIHHEAIDGQADTHPEDDGCPRAALPGGTDPNPDPAKPLKDTGCAGGVDVKTDVFLKP